MATAPNPETFMKLVIERDALLKAVTAAAAVVERRATIPVLSNVLIKAEGESVRIVASDLEIQIGMSVSAQVEAAGSITVSAAVLTGIVRELDDGAQVTLEVGDKGLQLTSGRGRYRLPVIPADEFPLMQAPKGEVAFRMGAGDLAAALKSIAYAMSDEETRFYLMGVHIDILDGRMALAATNGQCLGVAYRSVPEGAAALERGIILHRKLIGELMKLLDGAEGDIAIATDHERVSLELGKVEILSKLIDGQFPNWRALTTAETPHELKVRSAQLGGAVRRAVAISDAKVRSVRLDLSRDLVKVSVRATLNGEAAEEVEAVFDAPELSFGWQSRYVLNTLDAIGGEEIDLALSDARSPILFSCPTRPDGLWLIAPMTV